MSGERLRPTVAIVAAGVLLVGPTVLAFFSGGYFAPARAGAGIGAWALVAVAALTLPSRSAGSAMSPPRRLALWLSVGGMAALTAWTALSITWAPIAGDAYAQAQIAVVYLGVLIAAVLLLGDGRVAPWVEPVLAAGAVIVISYGLSERLVPGVLHFARSVSAEGRLQQPLTYWNAMGELAALGFVLCAGIAGAARRSAWQRMAAAAACAPLGLGLYVSFSRGALFACLAGLVALIVAARSWAQLQAAVVAVSAGVVATVVAAPSSGVTSLAGSLSTREREGAITLVVLVVVMIAAAVAQRILAARAADRPLALGRHAPLGATVLVCLGLAVAIIAGAKETSGQPALSGGATRLVTLQSNRYDYWDVALRAFATSPLHGVGAGGWSVYWLRWRSVNEFAQNAHSLELETLAELGIVGAALLLACFAGIGLGARDALASGRAVAGPLAALVAYVAHSPLDWDWQMPAVTLVAVVLAGYVLAPQLTAPRRSAAPRA
ncbi:MAG TPA: O-antigen ligase family protein [Solirubrobacteraceae bacterium]|nr:O-antigen ligase family protein [Solirubrobacteraceae bacterium]